MKENDQPKVPEIIEPLVLRCSRPRNYTDVHSGHSSITLVCDVTGPDVRLFDGFAPVLHVTPCGQFFCVDAHKRVFWIPVSDIVKHNPGLRLKFDGVHDSIPAADDSRLGIKGWTICIAVLIGSILINRGCDNGNRLVSPHRDVAPVQP